MNEHKIIFVSKSELSIHDPEELHSTGLNKWTGWWCSAGIRHLYISFDGLVYKGTCQEGGVIGSIYDESLDRGLELFQWIKCSRPTCACGPDMRSTKVLDKADTTMVNHNRVLPPNFSGLSLVPLATVPQISYSGLYNDYKLVIWELGRRCNYDCWYCMPSAHNNYESQKSLGTMKHGYNHLMKYWGMNQRIKFGFSGGESTFNPDYLEFVEYLKSQGHIIHTTTNGSHQPDYYSKLMLVSDITVSAHLDYLQQPRMYQKFLDNIQAAAHSKVSRPESNTNILEVRIMLQPGKLDQAQKLYQDLIPITSNVTVDLLHDKKKKIMDYSQSELAWTTSTISARQQPETDF